ncbi:hypothetical protein LC609_30910 [Nostoc sp. XA013]|nr:hypothetical protein [Nostoc sp. XA013]
MSASDFNDFSSNDRSYSTPAYCAIAFTNGNHNKQIHLSKYSMAYQNITASLSPADIQEIKAAFASARVS